MGNTDDDLDKQNAMQNSSNTPSSRDGRKQLTFQSRGFRWAVTILAIMTVGLSTWFVARAMQSMTNSPLSEAASALMESSSQSANLADTITIKRLQKEVGESLLLVDFPTSGNKLLRQTICEWINETLGRSYTGDLSDYQKLMNHYAAGLSVGNGEFHEYSKTVITKNFEDSKVITYLVVLVSYEGGAHEMSSIYGVTFRKTDAKIFTKDYITNYAALKPEIVKGLKEYFGVKTDSELVDCLLWGNIGQTPSVENIPLPTTDPWIDKNGVCFIYDEYEIAPYAAGMPYCHIPASVVERYVTATGRSFFE